MLSSRLARSVAVLPFANATGASDDLAISEGLSDELRARLQALPSLSVQATASSVSFRNEEVDVMTIAAALGVGRVINGSLRRRGRMLEVVVEIVDERGFTVEAPLRFERPETSLQALQLEIAARVSALLAPEAASAQVAAVTPTSASERATVLVLRGTDLERQVKEQAQFGVDDAKLGEAIAFYRQATAIDPDSLAAHSRLAAALLYRGDVEDARGPLDRAIELGNAPGSSFGDSDLSYAYFTQALYYLRTRRKEGVEESYVNAIELNPSNVDALGAYAQLLMVLGRPSEADRNFREAIRLDRRSLSRYSDYAEWLAIAENMDGVRAIGSQIFDRFPDARGYLALARLYEITGEIDVAIAWGLKALREQPSDDTTRGQVGELYARIGESDKAREFDPVPRMYQLYYERRYEELTTLAEDLWIEYPGDLTIQYMLGFVHNATGNFHAAKYALEKAGLPVYRTEQYVSGGAESQAMTSYVDALQGINADDPDARRFAEERIEESDTVLAAVPTGVTPSWWVSVERACAMVQLGRVAEALEALEWVKSSQGLVWSPLVQDSPCFKRIAAEPGYIALVEHLEEQNRILRERLPATLREYQVADVRPAQDEQR
jgi:tetratricopeptide (TPR) repeat protein